MKSKHFTGVFCWVFIPSGRRQEVELPFPTTSNFSYFSLLLILYWSWLTVFFQWNQIWTLLLPSQTPPQSFSQQEGMRAHICQKLVHKFPCSEMHCCTSSLNSTLSPEKRQIRKKSFVSALSYQSSFVKKRIPLKILYRKSITPSKKGRVWCVGSSLILCLTAHSPPFFAELADLIHNDALLDLVQWHSRSAQVWVSSPHCCQIQNTLCKCQHHV